MSHPIVRPIIHIENLTKRFGPRVVAVDDVTLDIESNEFFALLGPSGCGKTTLLRMLAGFERPSAGSLLIDGQDMTRVPPNRRPVNMVFQSYAVFPHMTVGANVAYGLKVGGVPRTEIEPRVREALAMVKLDGYVDRKPDQLSGGQRQRVALARALVKRPKVLLLDEPLSALDRKLREDMQLELVRLRHEVGITFIIVTHDQEEAMSVSSRIGVMEHGRIVQIGTPNQIYEHPRTRFVADFIGSINQFEARVVEVEGSTVRLECDEVAGRLVAMEQSPPIVGSPVWLGIRPEKATVTVDGAGSSDNRIAGEVLEIAYLGERSILHVRTDAGKIVRVSQANDRRSGGPTLASGHRVLVCWSAENSILLTP